MKIKKLSASCFLVTIMFGCSSTNLDYEYIKSKTWTHESGFKVGKGDIVLFAGDQKLFQLRNDTIFYEGSAKAIIKVLDKRYFTLTILSLYGNEKGFYINVEGQQLK